MQPKFKNFVNNLASYLNATYTIHSDYGATISTEHWNLWVDSNEKYRRYTISVKIPENGPMCDIFTSPVICHWESDPLRISQNIARHLISEAIKIKNYFDLIEKRRIEAKQKEAELANFLVESFGYQLGNGGFHKLYSTNNLPNLQIRGNTITISSFDTDSETIVKILNLLK